ncbi:ROK family glucokinase [Oceanobacillus damuensis]|uniref:ROK family glucokinase n=1 Tax=Oceanobacillus damuensis TaxID=937928 RepID=UPI0008323BB8|nr:ROK family glucokinase [Oceanobacillus damuensis]
MNELLIGIDIGGTTVKTGIIDIKGTIIKKWEIPTNTQNGGESIVDDIWNSIIEKIDLLRVNKASIIGIGVGAPGFIDSEAGYVYEAVNIGWKNLDLANMLKEKSGLPVFVENDANIAVLGENWTGAGNQADNLIAITLGTGVGGGIIANGSILSGENGMAGELGHIQVVENGYACNCGKYGCLETVTSATGIVRQAMEKISEYPDSVLGETFRKKQAITSKEIFELAKKGDNLSNSIIKRTADVLGKVIANMGVIINPSNVLIGGGVSSAGDQLISEIRIAFEHHALPRVSDACEIKAAQLGNDAGIIGGAYLVLERINRVENQS